MKKRKGSKSRLVCGACRDIAPIFRPSMQGREVGHIKHMYCPKCGKEQPFIEHTIHDKVELIWALEDMQTNSELHTRVRLYSKELGEFLTIDEQAEVLERTVRELRNEGHDFKVDLISKTLAENGYVLHVLKDYRP